MERRKGNGRKKLNKTNIDYGRGEKNLNHRKYWTRSGKKEDKRKNGLKAKNKVRKGKKERNHNGGKGRK